MDEDEGVYPGLDVAGRVGSGGWGFCQEEGGDGGRLTCKGVGIPVEASKGVLNTGVMVAVSGETVAAVTASVEASTGRAS